MERRERAGRDVTTDADARFLPLGWALVMQSYIVLYNFMVLAFFQYRASGFAVVLKKTPTLARVTDIKYTK